MTSHILLLLLLLLLLFVVRTQQVELKILNIDEEGAMGPPPCSLLCAGSTGKKTEWRDLENGRALFSVEIGECAFTSPPVVTITFASRSLL